LVRGLISALPLGRGGSLVATNPLAQRPPGDRRLVVLVSLLLADLSALERVAAQAARFPRLRVIVATDSDRVAELRAAGAVLEHFPAPAAVRGFPAAGDWATYLHRRWQLVLTKWQPALVREDGVSFGHYLEACGLGPSSPTRARTGAKPWLGD
jgi:hypothetical protein